MIPYVCMLMMIGIFFFGFWLLASGFWLLAFGHLPSSPLYSSHQGTPTGGSFGDKGHNNKKRSQTVGLGGSVSLAGGGVYGIQMGEKYEAQISPTAIFPEAAANSVVQQQQPLTPPPPQQVRTSTPCQFGLAVIYSTNTIQFCIRFSV